LDWIEGREDFVQEIAIEPEFVVRDSTARAPAQTSGTRGSEDSLRSAPITAQPERL
jgi:hypothetical protein